LEQPRWGINIIVGALAYPGEDYIDGGGKVLMEKGCMLGVGPLNSLEVPSIGVSLDVRLFLLFRGGLMLGPTAPLSFFVLFHTHTQKEKV
jgi:hypothetical protein